MVQFKNVSKKFENGFVAVDNVDFIINEGEFVFLIGPSGSGKTTLIELLIRDQKPSDGKIYIEDRDITHISRNKVYKLRRQIGVIFQDFKLVPDKTAYENVAFAMEAAGKSNKEIKEAVPYVLDIVGLKDRMGSFPEQLSGGEQQRVAIARAISNNPKLLIADEPTGNLDPASAWDIVQILTKINNWGTTVIMSTHGTDIVNTLNKRVIQMEDGKILRDDSEGGYEFTQQVDLETLPADIKEEVDETKSSFTVKLSEAEEKSQKDKAVPKPQGFFARLFRRPVTPAISNEELQQKVLEEIEVNEEFDAEITVPADTSEEEVVEEKENEKKKPKQEKKEKSKKELAEDKSEKKNSKKDKKEKKTEEKTEENHFTGLKEKILEGKDTPINFLNLPAKTISDLEEAGYTTVEEILEDGPEKLVEKSSITEEDVKFIAEILSELN